MLPNKPRGDSAAAVIVAVMRYDAPAHHALERLSSGCHQNGDMI